MKTDQGLEFTSRAFMAWAQAKCVRHILNQRGKPTQNTKTESFNGKFRDECLNERWFQSLKQARTEIAHRRTDFNEVRPLSSCGRMPPAKLAAKHRQVTGGVAPVPKLTQEYPPFNPAEYSNRLVRALGQATESGREPPRSLAFATTIRRSAGLRSRCTQTRCGCQC